MVGMSTVDKAAPEGAENVKSVKPTSQDILGRRFSIAGQLRFAFPRMLMSLFIMSYAVADGALISYEVKLVKPDRKIYETLCERFDITPENAVFLDDNAKNTEAAREFGLHAITVENKEQTDRDLHVLGVTW